MDKNLVYNLETNQINHYTQYKSDNGNVSTAKYILLPDGHIASLNTNRNNGETLKPYLVLFDSIFQPVKYYSDKKKRVTDKKRREHEGEIEDYIFDGYFYDEKCYNVIWKKGKPEPLYQSADDRFGYRIKADGKTYFVEMVYSCTDNKIYVPISPAEAVRKVPGIKPDDNPVIMEITLKD